MAEIDNQGTWPRAFLVAAELRRQPSLLGAEASLTELAQLADTAGLQVVGQTVQNLNRYHAATLLGPGKLEEIKIWVEELEAGFVIIDDELSPRQQRELEEIFGEEVQVIDRTALILDIFAQHADTHEGRLQVELAQYEYRLPRLTRMWTHLARQAGGGAARGGAGGVGLRGPGETQLEVDRREIGRRIARIKRDLEDVRAHRERHREKRRRSDIPVVALVGYTNAGKSTLLNALSEADVYIADQLFATLDPTTRRVELPGGTGILMTDTVGFIQKLPPGVIAAFRATLEEVQEADLLIHVADISHEYVGQHIQAVDGILRDDLRITDIPVIYALNKVDDLESAPAVPSTVPSDAEVLFVSARLGHGIAEILEAIEDVIDRNNISMTLQVPYQDASVVARFHELAQVRHEEHFETFTEVSGTLPSRFQGEFAQFEKRAE